MTPLASKPLPPGSVGLPLIGETLEFLRNSFGFVDGRLAKYGPVFKSSIVGRKTAVIQGPEATARFVDPELMLREGSMPPHIQALFAGRSLPLLDGAEHLTRKKIVLQGFTRSALALYLPAMQASIGRYLESWVGAGPVGMVTELQKLSIDVICENALQLEPGPDLDALRGWYGAVTAGFSGLPLALPGTRYKKALRARDQILEYWGRAIRKHRATPTDDILSRILGAEVDGTRITDEQAKLELHHVVLAGFIVWAEFVGMVKQLAEHPPVLARLRAEIAEKLPSGPVTLEAIHGMPWLKQVVMEVKRLAPVLPAVFAKAKRDFELGGVRIPAGWMVMWALRATHLDPKVYLDPEKFDPDRFSPERAEHERHEHGFVPQGAGPATGHRCPGVDYSTIMMSVFAILLARGYSWQLPPQDLEYDWKKLPPEPKDGLLAVISRR